MHWKWSKRSVKMFCTLPKVVEKLGWWKRVVVRSWGGEGERRREIRKEILWVGVVTVFVSSASVTFNFTHSLFNFVLFIPRTSFAFFLGLHIKWQLLILRYLNWSNLVGLSSSCLRFTMIEAPLTHSLSHSLTHRPLNACEKCCVLLSYAYE